MFKKSERRMFLESMNEEELKNECVQKGYRFLEMVVEGIVSKERQKEMGKKYRENVKEKVRKVREYEEKFGKLS